MKRNILLVGLVCFSLNIFSQTYQEFSEQALEWAGKDSLQKAEALFRQALRLEPANPHNALLFSNIGILQQRAGKYEEAVESYTLALNIAPHVISILLNRATAYMEIGKLDKAYVDYCEVLDLDKANTEALLIRAYIYVVRRDYPAARMDYNRVLVIDSNNYNARLGLITLNRKEQKYKDALELVNSMLEEKTSDPALYITRAGIEQEMGHLDLALIDVDKAISLEPSSTDAYVLRGEIYLTQKKKAQAKADFEKAISLGVLPTDLREYLQQCK